MNNIKIIIAAHKKYQMPVDDIYVPVQVGAKGKSSIGYIRDDTGVHISEKNPYYCELTGLYWGWKNLDCDYIGLVHYRRHFRITKKKGEPINSVITKDELLPILEKYDVLLPKRRNYYIDTLESHFNHVKYVLESDIPTLRKVIKKIDSSYVPYFDKCIQRTYGHMFNMFIMKKELADDYCEWLFSILKELEDNIDLSTNIHPARRRMIGYLSEFLIDVWVEKNAIPYKEIDTLFMEKQNELKKIYKFLIRKFRR